MKFEKVHLFAILLLALILCCTFNKSLLEGMENGDHNHTSENFDATAYKQSFQSGDVNMNSLSSHAEISADGDTYMSQDDMTTYTVGGENAPSGSFVTANGKQGVATTKNTVTGVPSSQIPPGQEDLYILKSEVVPPVCPACPSMNANCGGGGSGGGGGGNKCPPCPPCARCPEPAFECKKVPNYRSTDDRYLPKPVLNDFSQFGM
jgi:hypothetical protein